MARAFSPLVASAIAGWVGPDRLCACVIRVAPPQDYRQRSPRSATNWRPFSTLKYSAIAVRPVDPSLNGSRTEPAPVSVGRSKTTSHVTARRIFSASASVSLNATVAMPWSDSAGEATDVVRLQHHDVRLECVHGNRSLLVHERIGIFDRHARHRRDHLPAASLRPAAGENHVAQIVPDKNRPVLVGDLPAELGGAGGDVQLRHHFGGEIVHLLLTLDELGVAGSDRLAEKGRIDAHRPDVLDK